MFDIINYKEEYKDECISIISEVWPLTGSGLIKKEHEWDLTRLDFEIKMLNSNHLEIVLIDGKVSGILFGRISMKLLNRINSLIHTALKLLFFLLGFYGKNQKRLHLLKEFIKDNNKLKKYYNLNNHEVTLFVMNPSFKGQGIGKVLMNNYIDKVKTQNSQPIYLYTNEDCTWQFYEKYGFERIVNFPHRLFELFNNKKIECFIYKLHFK